MLLNLACSDGAIAGFGCVYIGLQPGHTLITYPISQEINVTLKSICSLSNKWLRLYRTPISTAAALEFGWPFSQELCVAYAMIMSTAGTYQSVSFIRKRFYVTYVLHKCFV
jgi:hypothetical protein